ncbi:ABC transporter permease [Crossiella sp. CA198]|uniref:ABC transporter permease n=1 Tax=Crossiella sp. CA198 TaxID=3455607 RepID=UPI003F8D1987
MTTATRPAPMIARGTARPGEIDSRPVYVGFGLAYLLGHGAAALSRGETPLLALPGWLPMILLLGGFLVGTVLAIAAALRAQKSLSGRELLSHKLIGGAWVVGMGGLFLLISSLHTLPDMPNVQSLLWPAGAGFVVGLLYLGEGAVRGNPLHYLLGAYLALLSAGSLFLGSPALFWALAIAGAGGFLVATVLEHRRLAASFTR